jgi:hypothetical protein
VTLLDGTVLVVGGACYASCDGDLAEADVFDPETSTFSPTAGKVTSSKGVSHAMAVLLPDGRVLVSAYDYPGADVYDPETRIFSSLPNTPQIGGAPIGFSLAARLRDGRVLLRGSNTAEADKNNQVSSWIFDPDTGVFTQHAVLQFHRTTANALPDGRALLIAGESVDSNGDGNGTLASIEVFDPASGMLAYAPYSLTLGRYYHSTALVRNGSVFVLGGFTMENVGPPTCAPMTATVEIVDPVKNTVMPYADMPHPNADMVATTLLDGTIVVVGGGTCDTTAALSDVLYLKGTDHPPPN